MLWLLLPNVAVYAQDIGIIRWSSTWCDQSFVSWVKQQEADGILQISVLVPLTLTILSTILDKWGIMLTPIHFGRLNSAL